MNMPSKKLPLVLFFMLSAIAFLRLLRITTKTSNSSPPLNPIPTIPDRCSSPSTTCTKLPSPVSHTLTHYATSCTVAALTEKELLLLSNLISLRAPCNLLFFGLEPQFLLLSILNVGGTTIFLEDDVEKIRALAPNFKDAKIYKLEHQKAASEAYELLKNARVNPACMPRTRLQYASGCQLALTQLQKEVYEREWDVVMVDGPRGDRLEAPGRMAAIYSASLLARGGKMTDVLVHDIDRTIEKWYSWEFLCDENLVSSKGKLWHFRIMSNLNSTSFCSNKTVRIE